MNYPESLLYELFLVTIDRILTNRNLIIELFIVQLNSKGSSWHIIDLEYLLYLELSYYLEYLKSISIFYPF